MPPPHKGPTSSFAAAAKVLFDSAQRVGAVQPLGQSSKQYAHQLKKIQSQSKKRGGSLGGVSYKVAEFLAAQRAPIASHSTRANLSLERTVAKKVPLIDIPPIPTKPPAKPSSPKSSPPHHEVQPPPPLTAPPLSWLNDAASPRTDLPAHSSPHARLVEETTNADGASLPHVEEVLVLEDKPLFEVRPLPAPQVVSPAVVQSVFTPPPPPEAAPIVRKAKPVVSLPIATPLHAADTSMDVTPGETENLTTSPLTFSVDAWEQQREKELERLQKKQDEEEQRRLALVRESEHQTLGKQWVEYRAGLGSFEPDIAPSGKLLREVYYAKSASSALVSFQRLLDAGVKAVALLPAGMSSVAFHIKGSNSADQTRYKREFLEMVEKAKLSDALRRKAHLAVSGGAAFLTAYAALTPVEKQQLDAAVIVKAVRLLVLDGQWEQAIELAKQSRDNFRSGSDAVDLGLLRVCRGLDEEPRKAVVAYASRSLTEQGRMGKTAKLLIARTEAGVYRRTLLKQLAASTDVDEGVYAELIVRSSKDQTEALLTEMESRGLSTEDPVVLGAIAVKKLEDESPDAVFKEIERQVSQIGLRPIHLLVAVKAASHHPAEGVLRQTMELVLSVPAVNRGVGLRKLLPLLYQHGMLDCIVELADKTSEDVCLTDLIPKAVAFVNDALLNAGRTPLNDLRVSDIGFSSASATTEASAAEKATPQSASVVADISGLTEKLLLYAKERQWARALDVVHGLPAAIRADASAVTLLYNCALSAAAERPDTVQAIYELMMRRSVTANSTTVNTVLSSLSKSTVWKEALPFFDKTPLAQRDGNTYLVYFALLGKQSLWREAIAAYDDMRQALPKPPAALFSLVINTTGANDWQATLRVFQDMLKIHGATVKENVVTQVIRSLEQNNRPAEIAKLQKELAKRKSKKKK